jgi:hypothetical protein
MRIIGFWHCYLINSWYTVVTDQLRIMLTSGLYDACEEINIGVIGFYEDRKLLCRLITDLYPKLKIRVISENPMDYEFLTLQLIEQDKSDYIGFYFHTKGVTRPFEPIISHWGLWLAESILNRWQEHAIRIQNSFDVSSVNEMKSPDHFSGNFWWFNRRYINRIPSISSLDHKNRFMAEQWICMCPDRVTYAKEFVEPGRDVFKMQYNHG